MILTKVFGDLKENLYICRLIYKQKHRMMNSKQCKAIISKHIIVMVWVVAMIMPTTVQAAFTPTAYYTMDGTDIEETSAINDAEAPLKVMFKANPENIGEGEMPAYEWRFTKNGETSPFLIRYEQDTEFEFMESGTYTVELYTGNDVAEGSITVSISASKLEMPNAFSPNGDGINDIYKAKSNHRSIVEFHAYIFSRHGIKIYDWTDINGGWDGTHNGKPVKDGVYFVLVKAKGADGRKYEIKRDVNILRDYIETSTPTN